MARALELFPAMREIRDELSIYESLLRRWQTKINLVAENTLDNLWLRHFADSAQVVEVAPEVEVWADLGSGAGFPGVVTGLLLKHRSHARVHLIESDQRKGAFLRAVSRETGAPVDVHIGRIENELPQITQSLSGISARALAPLDRLLTLARQPLENGAIGVFLKGEEWRDELTAAERLDSFALKTAASRTHPRARLILAMRKPRGET